MKLAAIFCVWDDIELLKHSIKNIELLVDGVLVIYSYKSNFGEWLAAGHYDEFLNPGFTTWHQFEPSKGQEPRWNETKKRQYGLDKARELGYTHFICMDSDEFYIPEEFNADKKRFDDPKLLGLVGRVKCYFKSPTLTIGYDTTLVPLIHKITPNLRFEFNKNYPFAWTFVDGVPFTHSKKIRIDPTRSMNINDGVEWSKTTMHHYSWVRSDIQKKIRNSTARENIEKSTIVQDYKNAAPGYFCQFYGKTLEACPNIFGIPEIVDASSLHP